MRFEKNLQPSTIVYFSCSEVVQNRGTISLMIRCPIRVRAHPILFTSRCWLVTGVSLRQSHPPNDWGFYRCQYVVGLGKQYLALAVAALRQASQNDAIKGGDPNDLETYRQCLCAIADEIESHGNKNRG